MANALYWTGTAWAPIRILIPEETRGARYAYAGDTGADPGTGGISLGQLPGQDRLLSISKTDYDGVGRNLLLVLPGDTITVTDDPTTPPVTGFARYVVTGDYTDHGTYVSFPARRTDTAGSTNPPPVGTVLRVIATLSGS